MRWTDTLRRAVGCALTAALAACGSHGSTGPGMTGSGVTLVATVPVPANYGQHDEFVRAGLAFLCSWNTGLQIYDVGDGRAGGSPQNPQFISRVVTAGGEVHNAWWFWAPDGQKRYVFVGQEGPGAIGSSSSGDIHVVDVSNLSAPVEVASYHMAGAGTHNFWVDETNQILYAAYYNGGVVALDISGTLSGDLSSRVISQIQPGGPADTYVWGVMLSNGSLYASDMLSGFWQLGLVKDTLRVLSGGNNVPERYGSDLWVANGYGYTGTWGTRGAVLGNAVKIWKLDSTGAPVLHDSIVTAGFTTVSDVRMSADGRMLVFSAEYGPNAGIYFYSLVADPGHPAFIAYWPMVTNNQNGIHTVTISDIGGRRYVFAAEDPPTPAMLVLDVTAISP